MFSWPFLLFTLAILIGPSWVETEVQCLYIHRLNCRVVFAHAVDLYPNLLDTLEEIPRHTLTSSLIPQGEYTQL